MVITGEAYYPDSTYPGHWIQKIILIKVKQNGEVIFEVPWGSNNGIYCDGRASTIDAANNIYVKEDATASTPATDYGYLKATTYSGANAYDNGREKGFGGVMMNGNLVLQGKVMMFSCDGSHPRC